MTKLSFAIICKDEANSITRCLESLKGADEIVICDTGSTDNTIEIAKKYTDKIFTDYSWQDDFAGARNYANSKCTGDWIFTIDCDCILKTSFEQIKKEIELAEKEGNQSVQVQCFEENGTTSHWLPLIYRNDPKIFWNGRVHNHINANAGRQGEIRIDYWYSDSHQKDPDRSFRILKKVVDENPNCVREKFYLAREYWYRHDYITAVHWYKKYLSVSTFGPEMADAYLTLAKCYWYMQEGDLARACCLEAIGLNANFKEALLFMAEMSGPGNKKRWNYFAESATNESILFVRTNDKQVATPTGEVKKYYNTVNKHIIISIMLYRADNEEEMGKFHRRLEIFKKEVLPRFRKQTVQNFDIAMLCDKKNDHYFEELGVIPIHTKDGYCGTETYGWNVVVPWTNIEGLEKYELQTIVGSDDLIAPNYVEKVMSILEPMPKDKSIHIHFQPRVYNLDTGEQKTMNCRYSDSFNAGVFSIYQPENKEHFYFPLEDDHPRIGRYFDTSILVGEGYCWYGIHKGNSSLDMNV